MHIKNIHCMVEKLAECAKCEVEKGIEQLNTEEMGEVTDMIKDLCEAEYYARIAKDMEKSEEEDDAEEKYIRKMLKEEHKDEYKRMREEYGEDEGERRFYDNYRYADGRFAPKGRGSYRPRSSGRRGRRGYEEPMYFLPPEVYMNYSPEELRDMDRDMGRMYYGGGSSGGNSGNGQSGNSGMSGGSQGGRRDGREGRSGQSRRSYMETKEMNKGNTPQEKQEKMKELEKYMKELAEDVTEMIEGATPEEKSLLKQKLQVLTQKVN